jgi:uncharacterized protein (TIGR02466 family)
MLMNLEKNKNYNIFPVPIRISSLNIEKKRLNEIIDFALDLEKKNPNLKGSMWADICDTWHSTLIDGNILLKLPDLYSLILKEIYLYYKNMGVINLHQKNIKITCSWININNKYSYQEYHKHETHFSGCFYIKLPKKSGNFIIKNQFLDMTLPKLECKKLINNPFIYDLNFDVNNNKDFYNLNEGDLILFPSNLLHRVTMNKSDDKRISLAFNGYIN